MWQMGLSIVHKRDIMSFLNFYSLRGWHIGWLGREGDLDKVGGISYVGTIFHLGTLFTSAFTDICLRHLLDDFFSQNFKSLKFWIWQCTSSISWEFLQCQYHIVKVDKTIKACIQNWFYPRYFTSSITQEWLHWKIRQSNCHPRAMRGEWCPWESNHRSLTPGAPETEGLWPHSLPRGPLPIPESL